MMAEITTPYDGGIAELEGLIKVIEETQIQLLIVKLNGLLQQWAEYLCPVKVGDMR